MLLSYFRYFVFRCCSPTVVARYSNTLSNTTIERHRRSALSITKDHDELWTAKANEKVNAKDLNKYRRAYPEFLPNSYWGHRDRICERLERMDMLRRRERISIPEFYVGSILAVTASDPFSPSGENRFVGICIDKGGHGLRSYFRLRNIIDGQGVEILYEQYNPSLLKIEVLRLEKRLDSQLLYLRDAPHEYSHVPFDLKPVVLPKDAEVPVNPIKVPLHMLPWHQRWEIKDVKGVILPTVPSEYLRRKQKHEEARPWLPLEKYDLMKRYRSQIHEQEQKEILFVMHFDLLVPQYASSYRYGESDDEDSDDALNEHSERSIESFISPVFVRWCPKVRREIGASAKRSVSAKYVLFCIGADVATFAETHIMTNSPFNIVGMVCSALERTSGTLSQMQFADRCPYIYRPRRLPDWLVVDCACPPKPSVYADWTNAVFSQLDHYGAQVIILCTRPATDYRSADKPADVIVRSLVNSHCKVALACPSLEPPNLVTGLPAEILAYCQLRNVRALLLIAWVSQAASQSEVNDAFRRAFPVRDVLTPASKSKTPSAPYSTGLEVPLSAATSSHRQCTVYL